MPGEQIRSAWRRGSPQRH